MSPENHQIKSKQAQALNIPLARNGKIVALISHKPPHFTPKILLK